MALILAEKYLLIAMENESGCLLTCSLACGLSACVLADLRSAKKIELEDGRILVVSTTETHDDILDAALAIILSDEKHRKIERVLRALSADNTLVTRVSRRLVDKGLMRESPEVQVGGLSYHLYLIADPEARAALQTAARKGLLQPEAAHQDVRTLAIVCGATALAPFLLTHEEMREQRGTVARLVKNDPLGRATQFVVETYDAGMDAGVLVAMTSSATV